MSPFTRTFSTVRAATTLAPARPAYAAGVRAAIATVGPMVVAAMLGSAGGTWLSLGGFNAALADKGGAYRDRATAMGAVMLGTALATLAGSLAGHDVRVAVPITFAVAFVASLARVWGATGASIGGASLSTYVIALAYPTHLMDALSRAGFAVAGSVWAMVVALLLWPLRPYRPARLAVSACYSALAGLIDEVVDAMGRATSGTRPEVPVGGPAVRAALESARHVLTQLRRGRPGSSGRGEQLVVLGDICDQLFGHVVAVTEAIETIPPARRDARAQVLVLELLQMIAATARRFAVAIVSEGDAPPIALGWDGTALRSLIESRAAVAEITDESALHYLHAASILDRAARFAETAATSAAALSNGPGATAEHRIPGDAVAEDDRGPSVLAVLRAILTPESVILHYALRVAVVVAVSVLLGDVLQLERAYWVTITVIVIMQPYTSTTTHRALQRVIGTVLGGILTAVLGATFHDPRAIMVLSFIFAALCVALMPLNYAAYSVFLTPTFVLLAEASAGDWHLAGTRVVDTLLGGALALAGARLLWPSPEWSRLPGYMAAALRANADYLGCVGELFDDRSEHAGGLMRAARRRTGLAAANAEESFQRLMGEYRGSSDDLAPVISFLTYLRRFTASTASLALARHAVPGETGDVVRPFTDTSRKQLYALAESIEGDRTDEASSTSEAADAKDGRLPPLLRARTDRLARQLGMLGESVRRYRESGVR